MSKLNTIDEAQGSDEFYASLAAHIAPDTVYRRETVESSENGWELWRNAIEKFVRPGDESDFWNRLVHGRSSNGLAFSAEDAQLARDILQPNEECLQLLIAGMERRQVQFSEFASLQQIQQASETINQLSDLAKLPLIKARLLASENDDLSAADTLIQMLRIGELVCNGDGQVLHYLVGLWIRGAALRSIGRLASMPKTSTDALKRMLVAVEQGLARPDGLQQSLRVDFQTITIKQLERTTDSDDLEAIVESIINVYYLPHQFATEDGEIAKSHDANSASQSVYTHTWVTEWVNEQRRQLLVLLQGHPRPFNKLDTGQAMADFLGDMIEGLNLAQQSAKGMRSWLHTARRHRRRNRLARQTRYWPADLSPGLPFKSNAAQPAGANDTPPQPATRSELELVDARHRLQKIDNPIGLILVEHFLSFDYSPFMLEHRTMAQAMQRLLTLRLKAI